MKPESQPIVGEDGELIQADPSVNPDKYAQYVATHVHRDPLLSRIRDHVSYYGCAYLFFSPVFAIVLWLMIAGGWTVVMVFAMFIPIFVLLWGALSADNRH